MNTFRNIIDLWPSPIAFATAIKINKNAAGMMYRRDSIPGKHFIAVVAAAADLGHPEVTPELLCRLAAAKREHKGGDG